MHGFKQLPKIAGIFVWSSFLCSKRIFRDGELYGHIYICYVLLSIFYRVEIRVLSCQSVINITSFTDCFTDSTYWEDFHNV